MAMDRYERQGCYSCAGVLSALGVLLMLILLPMTWKKVEYYQGCPRRRPVAPRAVARVVGRTPPPRRADSRRADRRASRRRSPQPEVHGQGLAGRGHGGGLLRHRPRLHVPVLPAQRPEFQ